MGTLCVAEADFELLILLTLPLSTTINGLRGDSSVGKTIAVQTRRLELGPHSHESWTWGCESIIGGGRSKNLRTSRTPWSASLAGMPSSRVSKTLSQKGEVDGGGHPSLWGTIGYWWVLSVGVTVVIWWVPRASANSSIPMWMSLLIFSRSQSKIKWKTWEG